MEAAMMSEIDSDAQVAIVLRADEVAVVLEAAKAMVLRCEEHADALEGIISPEVSEAMRADIAVLEGAANKLDEALSNSARGWSA